MNGTDTLKRMIQFGEGLFLGLAEDLRGHPMARPVDGGNHAVWCVGHVAYSDRRVLQMAFGDENPLAHWNEIFEARTEPVDDPAAYPSLDETIEQLKASRAAIVKKLDSLTDADLDKPAASPPESPESLFATVGGCLTALALHPMHHRGQLADVRKMLARKPLMV